MEYPSTARGRERHSADDWPPRLPQDDVQLALEHLYDYVYLQRSPLADLADTGETGWNRGAVLHRLLLDTIEQLRPPAGTPLHSQLWRRYRHAFLRYVESQTVAQIAEELGVSERQARRDNHEAVEAIIGLLRQHFHRHPTQSSRSGDDRRSGLDPVAAPDNPPEVRGTIPLDEALASALTTAANLAEAKGVAFEVQDAPVAALVAVDRIILRQILLGMIVGAVELTGQGGVVRISVEVSRTDANVTMTIPPAGPGAASSQAELDSRLTIARQLAAPWGCSIRELSTAQDRSIVLVVPIARTATILVVDDNPNMLRLFKRFLSGSDYAVILAQTPEDALRLARERQPDVITLDVMMPAKDGWEVLQALRAQPRTGHIPVIVCSVSKERDLARSLGAAAFLSKPITQADLLGALAAQLRPSAH